MVITPFFRLKPQRAITDGMSRISKREFRAKAAVDEYQARRMALVIRLIARSGDSVHETRVFEVSGKSSP